MFTTITPNKFDYIQISLKLLPFFQIYRLSLDYPNLRYIVCLIQKSSFYHLAFLIPKDILVSKILKIMIFINNIGNAIIRKKYLQCELPKHIHNRYWVQVVISSMNFNLYTKTRARVMEDLWYKNAEIIICSKCISIGINNFNIMYLV